jgi:hypothetical protein
MRIEVMHGFALVATTFLALGCVTHNYVSTQPNKDSKSAVSDQGHVWRPYGPTETPCLLGEQEKNAERARLLDVLAKPERYWGHLIRVRGYFFMQFENVSLLEPERREESIVVGILSLGIRSSEQIWGCHLKLVDVEGFLERVPSRLGNRIRLRARSMYSPQLFEK